MNSTEKLQLKHLFKAVGIFTLLFISVISLHANALEDHVMVVRNNSLIFDAYENVEEGTVIDEIGVSEMPSYGEISINEDQTLTFTPKVDICEETDLFVYFIRRIDGVDTVTVKVDILCETLTFLSGFSPNADGINDTFTILGVEAFPNNSLVVFNKWGEEVFAAQSYQNEWDGFDKDGESLVSEDNIYYYVFDDGIGNVHSGYIKINE